MAVFIRALLRKIVPAPVRNIRWKMRWIRSSGHFKVIDIAVMRRVMGYTFKELAYFEITFRDPNNLRIKSMRNNFSAFAMYMCGSRDPHIISFMQRVVEDGSTVIDIGANIGSYALPVARNVVPEGHVIAIEANARTFSYLRQNVEKNAVSNVVLVNMALGEVGGTIGFSYREENPGESHVASDQEDFIATKNSSVVGIIALDQLLEAEEMRDLRERIEYMKIDVEGYEPAVLRGARKLLSQSGKMIVQTEIVPKHLARYGFHAEDVVALMQECGFEPFCVNPDGEALAVAGRIIGGDIIWMKGMGGPAKGWSGSGRRIRS